MCPITAHCRTAVASAAVFILLVSGFGPSVAQDIDLGPLGGDGFRIGFGEQILGNHVSGAGDVNGDGLADLILQLPPRLRVYVIFGKRTGGIVQLGLLGPNGAGFRIDSVAQSTTLPQEVSGAGDVNGDGLDDLILGSTVNNGAAGAAYVVFGKADSDTIDLATLGNQGFIIEGIRRPDSAGRSVSGAGDVNGDGLDDLIVGADLVEVNGEIVVGESYVVFGKADSTPVAVETLQDGGFVIQGELRGDNLGGSVSGAGDVNGDGLADVVVGAEGADRNGGRFVGESYVVFGKANSNPVLLNALGSQGFSIVTSIDNALLGNSVSGAGDVNGDGLADLVVSAPGINSIDNIARSYVVFGSASNAEVDVDNLGSRGFTITEANSRDRLGISVAGAGDVNGDGLADLLLGSPLADPNGLDAAGQSAVVFGKTDTLPVTLGTPSMAGFLLNGPAEDAESGGSVSGAGDVDGDGLSDLIIAAEKPNMAYVVFSRQVPPDSATYFQMIGQGDPPRAAIGVTGDGSDASSPAARLWVDYDNGASPSNMAALQEVTLHRSLPSQAFAAAAVSWEFQGERVNWSDAEITVRYLNSELLIADEQSLQLIWSADGNSPFRRLPSNVNPANNTITARVNSYGFLFLGVELPDGMFRDGFE